MENRREFLKKAAFAGVVAGVGAIAAGAATGSEASSGGVVSGKSKKNEVLYFKSKAWEKFYKVAK